MFRVWKPVKSRLPASGGMAWHGVCKSRGRNSKIPTLTPNTQPKHSRSRTKDRTGDCTQTHHPHGLGAEHTTPPNPNHPTQTFPVSPNFRTVWGLGTNPTQPKTHNPNIPALSRLPDSLGAGHQPHTTQNTQPKNTTALSRLSVLLVWIG